MSGEDVIVAQLPGRFRTIANSKADLPTVGDWVLVNTDNDPALIEKLLVRQTRFSRREAGEIIDEQVVAANIDTIFIVTGLDDNYNPRRIERYLVLARDSGAQPVLILNKADIAEQIQAKITELTVFSGDAPILVTSAFDAGSVAPLRDYLGPGKTGALLGSSGVGKSTLINALVGNDVQQTGAVRDGDSKGRHTTTHRELILLGDGEAGMIIDTPGMRELQLWTDEDAIRESYGDVEDLATECRFTDCQHNAEPGCAVRAAVDRGDLDESRIDSFHKYQREIQRMDEKFDPAARAGRRRANKRFSKMVRKLPDKRNPD